MSFYLGMFVGFCILLFTMYELHDFALTANDARYQREISCSGKLIYTMNHDVICLKKEAIQ